MIELAQPSRGSTVRNSKGSIMADKQFVVNFTFEDRKEGPTGRTIRVAASGLGVALARATREFLSSLDRKQRFDANKSGLTAVITRVEETVEEPKSAKAVAGSSSESA
jgi:hypothetical protein